MAGLSSGDLSALIGSIYDCVIDPGRWKQTLEDIACFLQGEKAILSLNDLQQNRILIKRTVGWEPNWLEVRERHLPAIHDVVRQWFQREPSLDVPFVASREIPASELLTLPYVQQCLRPQGLADLAHFFLISTPAYFSEIVMFWHDRHGPVTDHEINLAALLLPHLRRAVTISNVLDVRAIERAQMSEALDVLRHGVLLTNEQGAVLHANSSAQRMTDSGGPISINAGMLCARRPSAQSELKKAIRLAALDEAQMGKTGTTIRLSELDQPPVFAHVLPMTGGEMRTRIQPGAVAAVFIEAATRDRSGVSAVAAGFGLTPAETRLLASMLTGLTLIEAADELGIAITTARTHLNSIFRKTGVSRQAELMQLATRMTSLP